MLDIEKIQKLVDMMIAHDLVELSLRDGDVEVNLRRGQGNAAVDGGMMVLPNPAVNPALDSAEPGSATEEPENLSEIHSPMVGTFYGSPDPDSPPFVQVGSRVQADTVVCIVEAMKVFNEIKAEVAGTIDRILVKNETPIEYGQPLFLVRTE